MGDCEAIVHPATRYEPVEYCGNDCAPGEDLCEDHGGSWEPPDTIQEGRYER